VLHLPQARKKGNLRRKEREAGETQVLDSRGEGGGMVAQNTVFYRHQFDLGGGKCCMSSGDPSSKRTMGADKSQKRGDIIE